MPLEESTKIKLSIAGLSLIFVGAGIPKISSLGPLASIHETALKEFVIYAKVFPLRPWGIHPEPEVFMWSVGIAEFVLGISLYFGTTKIQKWSCLGLMAIMAGATTTLITLGKSLDVLAPSILLSSLFSLYTRLDHYGNSAKEEGDDKVEKKD